MTGACVAVAEAVAVGDSGKVEVEVTEVGGVHAETRKSRHIIVENIDRFIVFSINQILKLYIK
jgi:hypothetical protein